MYLVTYKGNKIDYLNITADSIDVDDIIHSLPRINRFIGHSSRAYSVAEHTIMCLIMAEMLGYSTREKVLVFIHDFTEAYTGDCPTPLKRLLPDFKMIEERFEHAIYEKLGVDSPTEEEYLKIKRIDWTMLAIEMRDLTLHDHHEYMVDDYTYEDMLEDDMFNMKSPLFSEEGLQTALTLLLNHLLDEYAEELKDGKI